MISQDYFDEVCLENAQVFDLNPDEALQETLQQLKFDTTASHAPPLYLILNFPTSETGIQQRKEAKHMETLVQKVQQDPSTAVQYLHELCQIMGLSSSHEESTESHDDNHDPSEINQQQKCIQPRKEHDNLWKIARFVECMDGIHILCQMLWNTPTVPALPTELEQLILSTLFEITDRLPRRRPLPPQPKVCLSRLIQLEPSNRNTHTWQDYLRYVFYSIRRCEDHKKQWMRYQDAGHEHPALVEYLVHVVEHKDKILRTDEESLTAPSSPPSTLIWAYKIITSLCTYDDDMSSVSPTGNVPTISSAHANVQDFWRTNLVPRLGQRLSELVQNKGNYAPSTTLDSPLVAILACLRSLCIQDNVVQSMVACGIMTRVLELFIQSKRRSIQAHCIGFFRNLSANDEIKTTLCQTPHVCSKLLDVMQECVTTKENPAEERSQRLLLEHACGTIAAMALRQPRNATLLISSGAHVQIRNALRRFPESVTLCRQAALAVRNLASRASEQEIETMKQAGVDQALQEATLRHPVGCQDEIYAALRDLGVSVTMMHAEEQHDGRIVMREQRRMFGERNSNFRPVFD